MGLIFYFLLKWHLNKLKTSSKTWSDFEYVWLATIELTNIYDEILNLYASLIRVENKSNSIIQYIFFLSSFRTWAIVSLFRLFYFICELQWLLRKISWVVSSCLHHSFEFRLVILNWLLPNTTKLGLPYYFLIVTACKKKTLCHVLPEWGGR